jgi:hypothetical protein
VVTTVDSGDQPSLRAVEVVRPGRAEMLNDLAADEVDLEEAGRHRNRNRVRPAGERDGDVSEHGLLVRRVLIELS